MSLRNKAIQGVKWSIIQKWGAQIVSTTIFLVLARLLGPEAFGLIALADVALAFVRLISEQGFSQAIIQKDKLEPEHLDTAFWTDLLLRLLAVAVIFSGAGFIANFYKEPALTPIIRWMSLSLLISGLNSVQAAILKRNMQFKFFAVRALASSAIGGSAGIIAALTGLGAWSLVIKHLTTNLINLILLWNVSKWRPNLRFSISHFKDLYAFGINIFGSNVVSFFNQRSDNMLIGYYLGPVALGYYTVGYRLLLIMVQLLTNVTAQVALPIFSRMQQEPERMRKAFYQVTEYTSLISFPAFLGMAVLAPELVQSLFGNEWLPSVPVMRILAFVGILQSIYFFNGTILLAIGKPGWRLKLQCLNATCNVITFFILVKWGIAAVATGFVVRSYILSPIPLIIIKRVIKIKTLKYLRQFRIPLITSLIMSFTLLSIKYLLGNLVSTYLLLSCSIVIGILVYLISLFLLAPTYFTEAKNIMATFQPK